MGKPFTVVLLRRKTLFLQHRRKPSKFEDFEKGNIKEVLFIGITLKARMFPYL